MLRGFLLFVCFLRRFHPCFADAIDELNAAVKALERGQPERARDLVKVVINDVHTSNEYKAMAYYLYSLPEKNPQEAITYCAKAAELAPDNGRYHEKLGILYFQAQQYEKRRQIPGQSHCRNAHQCRGLRGLPYENRARWKRPWQTWIKPYPWTLRSCILCPTRGRTLPGAPARRGL